MSDSSTQGIKTVLHPVAYWHVPNLEATAAGVTDDPHFSVLMRGVENLQRKGE